jgi:hypothetical protein
MTLPDFLIPTEEQVRKDLAYLHAKVSFCFRHMRSREKATVATERTRRYIRLMKKAAIQSGMDVR